MGIFSNTKLEQRTQLYFRDDGKFSFIKRDVEDTFLVSKVDNIIERGWMHYYALQFAFAGYHKILSDMVTLAFARDIILDPFNIVNEKEKPDKDKPGAERTLIKTRITEIAETQRYKHQNRPTSMFLVDKLTLLLGACAVLLALASGLKVVIK